MEPVELAKRAAGQEIAAETFDWGQQLSNDVTELILARVPLSSLVRACAVSKHWNSLIHCPGFAKLCSEVRASNPWLFIYCTNFLVPSKNQGYAFDPDAHKWYAIPSVTPPLHSRASMAGGVGGIMFATMGGNQSRLCYNHSLFVKTWKQTTEMSFARDAPLVGFLEAGRPGSSDKCTKLIAVGGVEIEDNEDDLLAVEIYDAVSNKWEVTKSLPGEFGSNNSRHWLSGTVWTRKLYVLEIYSGSVSYFDLQTKCWSPVRIIRPMTPSGVKYAYLVTCQGMLILAGVCHPPHGEVSFKLWLVDDSVMECTEMGAMPAELFSLFAKGQSAKSVTGMKCVASGSLVYVYSVQSPDGNYPMVVCDISQGWNAWKKLPAMPTMGSRFDAMVGFSSSITLDSFFQNEQPTQ